MSDGDDVDLLDRWCAGDKVAGNELVKRHFESLYRFFEHKVDRRGDADELVQETLIKCVSSRDAFRRQSSFRTYLFTIARHALYGYWRQRAGRTAAVDFEEVSIASLSTSVGTRLARQEDSQRLLTALRTLPADQQLVLELFYWEGLDGDQIAEVFAIAPATVRSRLFRARDALRAVIDERAARLILGEDLDRDE